MPPDVASPSTPVTQADVSNASALNGAVSAIRQALSDSSTAAVAVLNFIATAVTQKLLGGVVGTTTNRLLKSKTVSSGSSAGSLQATGITCDASDNLSGGTWQGTVISAVYGGTGVANNVAGTLTWSNTGAISITFPSSGTLAVLTTNTWTQEQGFATATLTDAATISWNLQTQQTAKVTLGGNRTLGAPTNMVDGFTYILRVIQDGTGSRTLAYNAVFKWPGGAAPVLSTAAGAIDILTFVSDGTNMYGAIQKAFA